MAAKTSIAQLAAHLGLSRSGVQDCEGQGIFSRADGLDECRLKYIKHLRQRRKPSTNEDALKAVRVRKEELAIAERERELVPLADAMTLVDEVCGAVVARVNAIPARFTRDIAQRTALQREVDEALTEVADHIEKLGGAFSSGRDDTAPDEEDV